ncbi:hypothetical protein Tco_1172857 [Tanacetum coccineum]
MYNTPYRRCSIRCIQEVLYAVSIPAQENSGIFYSWSPRQATPIRRIEFQYAVKIDDPNITMEEYIRLEKEKAHRRGKVYNWETATYGNIWYDEDVHDLRSVETEFPANDAFTSEVTLSYEPTKIIFVNDLKTDSENDNDKVNMPLFPSPEPMVSYFDDLDFFKDFKNEFPAIVYNDALASKSGLLTETTISIQRINEFDLKNETSFSKCDEEEQNVLYFNNLFPFNVIYPDNLKSDTDNDNDEIDIEQPSGDMSVIPLPNVINVNDGAYAHGSNKLLETSHDKSNKFFKAETFIKNLNFNIMNCNYIIKGTLINLFKNLYVLFGIPFDPKLFYKDGSKLKTLL